MRNNGKKKIRAILAFALALAVGVTFIPISADTAYAANFSTSKRVANVKVTSYAYDYIKFRWDAYSGASGYQVVRATSENGPYTRLARTKSTSFKNTTVNIGTKYYYKVRAYKKSGDSYVYSKYSSVICRRAKPETPKVTIASYTSKIKLTWNKVPNVTGYEVYRATSKNGTYTRLGSVTGCKYTNTKGEKAQVYYYKVKAYKTLNGERRYGGYSSKKQGMMGLSKATGITATSASNGVQLKWNKISGVTGYEISRSSKSGSSGFSTVGTATTNSFLDTNVANGMTYYYRVRAYKQLDGSKVYGDYNSSGYSRSKVVSTAVAWYGCKESNKSNKPIIDLYNKNMGTNFSYTTAWCAMFVSAVAIKSGTTSIIVRGSYCPTVRSTYVDSKTKNYSYGKGKNYKPKAGDVIFFDWNYNGVPDHTGLVVSVSGNTIKTIEGNYSDAVGYRTFSVGYSYVQGYGLPNYDDANGIVYTGKSNTSVGCGELTALGIGTEPEGYEDLGDEYDFVEKKVEDNIGCDEKISDYEKMTYMVKKVRTNAETEGIDCSKTQYYAAFIYQLCKEADIEASIMTAEDADGNVNAWIETQLDGKWYKVDASKSSKQIERFEHEATDIEG